MNGELWQKKNQKNLNNKIPSNRRERRTLVNAVFQWQREILRRQSKLTISKNRRITKISIIYLLKILEYYKIYL